MKILQTSHLPQGSGSGVYINNLSSELTRLGHQSYVLTVNNSEAQHPDFGIHSVLFNDGENSGPYDADFNFPCFDSHPATDKTFGDFKGKRLEEYISVLEGSLNRTLEEEKPDIVHCHHGWVFGYLLSQQDVPYVVSLHGTELIGFDNFPWYQGMVLEGLNNADMLLALTPKQEEKARSRYNLEGGNFNILGGGVDIDLFKPTEVSREQLFKDYGLPPALKDRPVVFFAGEHTPIKGIPYLLEAAKRYEQSEPSPLTILAGNGKQLESNIESVKKLGLKNVFFIGRINQPEMVRWFSSSDLFVVPSTYEAFGLVAAEALACGCPVAATDVGGLSTIVNKEVGRILEPRKPGEIYDAVMHMIGNDFKKRIITQAREYVVKNFSWRNITQMAESFYQQVLSQTNQDHLKTGVFANQETSDSIKRVVNF